MPNDPGSRDPHPAPLFESALVPAPTAVLMTLLQPGALFLLDAGSRVASVGGAWEALTGTATRDALGQLISNFIRSDDPHAELFAAPHGQLDGALLKTVTGERRARVTWRCQDGWTAGHLELLAPRAAAAFRRELQLQELELAVEALIQALGKHLEGWERAHVERVAGYAVRFGEVLGLPPERLRLLRWGAYLHDVGKTSIPDAVLFKNGALSHEERGVVQQHPVRGHEVIGELPFLPAEVREIVLHHHERWDGGGYPYGLRGEAIPFLARILAVVDVFEALTSARSYKEAWSATEAAEYLLREAGRHFDPTLVLVFVRDVLKFDVSE